MEFSNLKKVCDCANSILYTLALFGQSKRLSVREVVRAQGRSEREGAEKSTVENLPDTANLHNCAKSSKSTVSQSTFNSGDD